MISMIALTNIPVCVIPVHGVVVPLSRQKIQVPGVSAFMKKILVLVVLLILVVLVVLLVLVVLVVLLLLAVLVVLVVLNYPEPQNYPEHPVLAQGGVRALAART